jgi:aspartate kinase
MEGEIVSSIAYDKDQARFTLRSVADRPGVAAAIFGPLAEANVVVDMIVQNASRDGLTDMTFTVARKDLKKTLAIMDQIQSEIEANEIVHDLPMAKISVVGAGMRNHSGVAAKAFAALQSENINILLISTSEIKITCLIEERYTELAVRTLHDAFNLKDPCLNDG